MSLASSEAAEARRRAETTVGHHNLRLGPTAWSFAAGLGSRFSDNVWSAPPEIAEADVALEPQVNARMLWPISDRNSISLALGGGYSFYLQNPEFSRYFINPGSEISLDVYVGPFWVNLHDRVSVTQNTYQDPTVVGNRNYSRLENTLGFTGVWDLNKFVVRLGYDHANYVNLASDEEEVYPEGQAELFFGSLAYVIRPELTTGLELSSGLVSYDLDEETSLYSEALQTSAGTFFDAQMTEYIKGRIAGGYTLFNPLNGTAEGDDYSGFYMQLGLKHRVNQYVEHSLTAAKRVSFTLSGGTVDMYLLNWSASWNLLKDIRLVTRFTYEHGTYPYGVEEVFDRFGPGLTLSKRLGERLTANLSYTRYWRESNLPQRNYTANVVSANVNYQF
jgi:hypothetical protein